METEAEKLIHALQTLARLNQQTREDRAAQYRKHLEANTDESEEFSLRTFREETLPHLKKMMELSKVRKSAYLDAFEALMRLYAYESARPGAEQIMALLRQTRWLTIEQSLNLPAPSASGLLADQKGEYEDLLQDMGRARRDSRGKRLETTIARLQEQNSLLSRALQTAQGMVAN